MCYFFVPSFVLLYGQIVSAAQAREVSFHKSNSYHTLFLIVTTFVLEWKQIVTLFDMSVIRSWSSVTYGNFGKCHNEY